MIKKIAFILSLAVPMFLTACGGSSTAEPTPVAMVNSGVYKGNVTGLNAGPATITVSAANVVSGEWLITNREGGPYNVRFRGTVDANGKLRADAYHLESGTVTMYFDGVISATGRMSGTWGEYIHGSQVDGAFDLQR